MFTKDTGLRRFQKEALLIEDPDVKEFGNCFCALYVSQDISLGNKNTAAIPERRPPRNVRKN